MTKQEWIEVMSLSSKQDGLDIAILIITGVSAIGVLLSAFFAAKAANAANKAANLNIKLFEEQKTEEAIMKKTAFLQEYQKLHASIYFIPEYKTLFDNEPVSNIPKLRVILNLAFTSIEKVDISVFPHDIQEKISLVTTNLGFRAGEINNLKLEVSTIGEQMQRLTDLKYLSGQYHLCSSIISDLLLELRKHEYIK